MTRDELLEVLRQQPNLITEVLELQLNELVAQGEFKGETTKAHRLRIEEHDAGLWQVVTEDERFEIWISFSESKR